MSHLFQPLRLRDRTLVNRIVVSPMCQYSALEGVARPWHTVHLGQLAMADAGLLLIEATAVEPIGRITPGCLGLYDNACEAALTRLLTVLRGLNPARRTPIGIQLAHAGRKGSSHVPWQTGMQIPLAEGGWTCVAPSAVPPSAPTGSTCRAAAPRVPSRSLSVPAIRCRSQRRFDAMSTCR